MNLLSRLMSRLVETDTGCWEWTGGQRDGYGAIGEGRKTLLVHRVAYEQLVGPIAEGKEIDHTCHNTICCNPAHLEPVTPAVNCQRRRSTRLDVATADHIRTSTESNAVLARRLQVDPSLISRIRRGTRWKELTS